MEDHNTATESGVCVSASCEADIVSTQCVCVFICSFVCLCPAGSQSVQRERRITMKEAERGPWLREGDRKRGGEGSY